MKVGSLFSGGGLGDLGFVMAGCEIVFQVEIDEYCQKILELRYPDAKKFRDIRTVKGIDLPECDLITGGFPCQPFSVAGKQDGKGDNRYLWSEMSRIISEVKPAWVVAENVPGIIDLALDDVLADLEGQGYETITIVFPAHAIGARHRRDRVWIVGNAESKQNFRKGQRGFQPVFAQSSKNVSNAANAGIERVRERQEPADEDVADAKLRRCQEQRWEMPSSFIADRSWWQTEPAICRVVDGCSYRVDRLKCLGNGQVPFVTKWIAERIIEFERNLKN